MSIQHHLIGAKEVPILAEALIKVLEQSGAWIDDAETLAALEAMGARVSWADKRVAFPGALVSEQVRIIRGEHPEVDAPVDRAAPAPELARLPLPRLDTQVAQFIYDMRLQAPRPATPEDLVHAVKLGDVLHGEEGVGHALTLSKSDPFLEPLEAGLILARHARLPEPPFAWNVRQIPYLERMGHELGLERWYTLGALCIAHPFRFDRLVAEKLRFRATHGYPTGLTAMPVAGVTTPVTRAGFVVTAAAEILACWLAARAINPAVPLRSDLWPGTVDLRSGQTSYSTPDSLLYGFTAAEFLRRYTGVEIPIGGADYTDARRPGRAALYEKAAKGLAIAFFSGRYPLPGEAMLDKGRVLCLPQLVLEREYAQGLRLLGAPLALDDEQLALPSILEIGTGGGRTHLETSHTLAHLRETLWCPPLLDRSGAADEEELLVRSQARVEEAIAAHRPPERSATVLAALQRIVDEARREHGS